MDALLTENEEKIIIDHSVFKTWFRLRLYLTFYNGVRGYLIFSISTTKNHISNKNFKGTNYRKSEKKAGVSALEM